MMVSLAGVAFAYPGNMGPSRSAGDSNAFYDDHYGPLYDGYWSASGEYFFTTGPNRPYVRDNGYHFSRVMTAGTRPVESLASARPLGTTASR